MANKVFGLNVDFNLNQTIKQRFENLISAPTRTASDAGYIYFNTTDGYPYLWTGTIWLNLGSGTSTVWRKSDGLTPADSYTERIQHNGTVVLNGVAHDAAYNNSMGSTYFAGNVGILGTTIGSENTTGWLNVRGNQGIRIQQINQNVGYIQLGNDGLGTMAGNQVGDRNVSVSRPFTASTSQSSDPNWINMELRANVNYTNATGPTNTFTSLKINPTRTAIDVHYGIDMLGRLWLRDYNQDVTYESAVRGLGVSSTGKVVTTGIGGGGSVAVEEEGVTVVGTATVLNFVGTSVTATDAGAGQVDVTITGGGGAANTVTDYVSDYVVAEQKLYQGYNLNSSPVITRTDAAGTVETATGLTDLATDWPNRLSLTYV